MHVNRISIPPNHPRAKSLHTREALVDGYRRGLVVAEGLIAHGRGEAYDYLIGECTTKTAQRAIKAAAAMLLLSRHPVISVNGNAAALCPGAIVELAKATGAAIEINLFYRTEERERAIKAELETHGAENVLGVGSRASATIPELQSERRRVDPDGIYSADTVFVPLEDGDRTEALVKMGKKVITIDLNPLSRTAKAAHITIVDNIVRAMPALAEAAHQLNGSKSLKRIVDGFDNKKNLRESLKIIRGVI
ncbi:putative pantothenate synthetase [Candidatus Nitrososphaera gargensis Ga9.2]|uniref:4-phosphopantoate--beta-alanine ligase n=1 Tax=Nitrososphaera gargensis (strain Ga9.2) TaxID=1237085 RepID=K0IIV1_NITGG|nr:4-phosphopantoate--beta-alanine ligase [Candidatus Nitrososphaera gargensis]AFU58047.1 putative pantothenate synthetase [Candidatus Nitrososphaera gargensis Ga9.2]